MRGGKVGRSLYQAGDVRRHLFHSVRNGEQGSDNIGCIALCDGFQAAFDGFCRCAHSGIGSGIFFCEQFAEGCDIIHHFLKFIGRNGKDGLGFTADGVGLVAAVD